MGKSTTSYRSDRAYEVEANRSIPSMSCTDKCINKLCGRWCIIGMCVFAVLLVCLLIIAAIVFGVVIYEINESSYNFKECNIVHKDNIYVADIDKVTNDCIDYYNISKIFAIGNDVTLISDCKFLINDEENQLILNKLDQTSKIIADWSKEGINILISDKDNNSGPAIAFAYLLNQGISYNNSYVIIQQIPDIDITYNFMQQLKLYADYIQNGTSITDYQQELLWSNISNNIVCTDI